MGGCFVSIGKVIGWMELDLLFTSSREMAF